MKRSVLLNGFKLNVYARFSLVCFLCYLVYMVTFQLMVAVALPLV